ncbi:hypothetical protein [Leeuwenhoekiella nanhaiensis]|uniref:TonB-dependent receptor plug domain-containing protein n=1 Tax=Leeuwenhoekiella nanhaiensis TaxID=1655491 RepID=A0A2G1VQ35_9FLAO|nr:hypothetical protein [Leeuwenhoekiella nanhaiensis]PHQ28863.1 hypothetical protein CJ305_11745 [Leeuwenhoekiella nanhaiensis]
MIKLLQLTTLLLLCISAKAQVADSIEQSDKRVRIICSATPLDHKPLYVVELDEDRIELDNSENFTSSIDRDWIKAVSILKKDKDIEVFGEKAKHGVIHIKIKARFVEQVKQNLTKNSSH